VLKLEFVDLADQVSAIAAVRLFFDQRESA